MRKKQQGIRTEELPKPRPATLELVYNPILSEALHRVLVALQPLSVPDEQLEYTFVPGPLSLVPTEDIEKAEISTTLVNEAYDLLHEKIPDFVTLLSLEFLTGELAPAKAIKFAAVYREIVEHLERDLISEWLSTVRARREAAREKTEKYWMTFMFSPETHSPEHRELEIGGPGSDAAQKSWLPANYRHYLHLVTAPGPGDEKKLGASQEGGLR